MTKLPKVTLASLVIWVAGSFIGVATGAIGICGNGGWGTIPAIIGFCALPVFLISLTMLIFRLIRDKFY